MFSLKRTVFILSIAMLSAATVKLAAQDAAPSDAQSASGAQETKEESGNLIRRGVASLKKGAADIKAGTSGLVKAGLNEAKDKAGELADKGVDAYRKGAEELKKGAEEIRKGAEGLTGKAVEEF